ncbi:MAG: hypothetical protein RBR59_02220 [Sulfurimonadaceae bacterium]|jgi:hypothetical protein|nr:hypothetical protein [Sulfurimonadaceae bacterium]
MFKFYSLLWLRWAFWVTLLSISFAFILSFFGSFIIYLFQGMPTLEEEIIEALWSVFWFLSAPMWSFVLFIVLFIRLKFIFNTCTAKYQLRLLACDTKEPLEVLGYGNIAKVWRKWFMGLIWLVVAITIVAIFIASFLFGQESLFDWFTIYWLYGFILMGGYFSFMLLGTRCKNVRIVRC